MRVVAGKAKGVVLKTPEGMQTRPTADRVKEALFSILQFDLPGTTVLDLFGGTGQLGIEAISRGAKSAVFVDAGDAPCKLIKENLRRAKMEGEGRVVRADYLQFLSQCREKFDIIFLDPPYAEVFLENSIKDGGLSSPRFCEAFSTCTQSSFESHISISTISGFSLPIFKSASSPFIASIVSL